MRTFSLPFVDDEVTALIVGASVQAKEALVGRAA
jgi:hypothetical protein